MGGFLIDTNIISEFVRPAPSVPVKLWFEAADPNSLFASIITVGEIRLGTWGQITIGAKRKGVTVSTADGLIAATAIEHGLRLVTRNVKDFAVLGVPLTNPWEISARDA